MTRLSAIAILSLLLTGPVLYGQQARDTLSKSGILSLRVKSISFIKNNEYYSPVIEGYTLIGFFIQPELVYSPSEKITLRAGTHLLKYSGTDRFTEVRPVFSASLKLADRVDLTLGSLSGSDRHEMIDPHFNYERLYNAYVEDGAQLTFRNEHFFNDTWLSWENFIFKGDSTREILTAGESFRYKSSPVAGFMQFEVPLQIQFKHFGGQISNYPEPVETFFNLATGLKINFMPSGEKYGRISMEYLQFINRKLTGDTGSGVTSGYASWIRLFYSYKPVSIGIAYWKAHNFYAPNGNTLYGSVSDYQPGVIVPDRRIITNSFFLNLLPESYLGLFLGFETYYDIDLKRMDNAATLHLNFDKLFKLLTIKN